VRLRCLGIVPKGWVVSLLFELVYLLKFARIVKDALAGSASGPQSVRGLCAVARSSPHYVLRARTFPLADERDSHQVFRTACHADKAPFRVKVLAFVLPLGFDTLAVSILLGVNSAPTVRVALTFTIFETLMPVFGILIGGIVPLRFQEIGALLGGLMLFALGTHVLLEAKKLDEEVAGLSFTTLRFALLAGASISLDELAIGFPMRMANVPVIPTLLAIAVQAFVVSSLGVSFGRKLGERTAIASGAIAGVAFIGLGFYLGIPAVMQLHHQ
jgi:putative Mn2+ efflux pump MntP